MNKFIGLVVVSGMLAASAATPALAADAPNSFKKCKACHKVTNDNTVWTVGPGLKGISQRVSPGYLEKSLTDPQGAFDAGGPEIEALKNGAKFKTNLKMPKAVNKLTGEDVKELVEYLSTL